MMMVHVLLAPYAAQRVVEARPQLGPQHGRPLLGDVLLQQRGDVALPELLALRARLGSEHLQRSGLG